MLNIYVLIKQVPKTQNLLINKRTGALIREGIESIINPDDVYALELGLSLKEKYGGNVTAMTMGPPPAKSALREALAMGVDNAIIICDPIFAYSDTLQTTLVLRDALEELGDYDLIITGSKTSDSSTGQVPYQLSEALDIPLVTDIFSMEIDDKNLRCGRNFGHEYQDIEVKLPVVLRIEKHFNEPRHIPLVGIKKAYEQEIEVLDFDTLNCPDYIDGCNKSPTQVTSTEKFKIKRKNEVIEGTLPEKIEKLIEIMQEHGIERIWTGSPEGGGSDD
ncbi:MAG: electron transfer flavoprotein subunit beta/FixA family protein [Promethearchaeia archaeon]